MDIDGLGKEIIKQLVDAGLVRDITDLYALQAQDLLELDKFAAKSANNLIEAIALSREAELWRFIHGLGIPLIGAEAAKVLATKFGTMGALVQATPDLLNQIDGIGPKMTDSLVSYFLNEQNARRIERLYQEAGLRMESTLSRPDEAGPLLGKTFVLTGTLPSWTRDEAKARIETAGGKVTSSVSRKTSYVVSGDAAGSKLRKAQDLGIPILNQAGLEELLGDSGR
jgi:DNA ligase (NAD+)